ncbi:MAG: hypothetical protein A2Y97_13860 [Nitrospirae bacterium RBG_13_39_12]|nr:MAG: hypothetical protein A2Y97_13860 [Nitrospirae bacterium RBG_13_39_12]
MQTSAGLNIEDIFMTLLDYLVLIDKKFQGFIKLTKQEGVFPAFWKVIKICIKRIYYRHKIIYLKHSLENKVPIPETKSEFQWRLVQEEDFKKIEEFYRPTSSKETPARRFEKGDFCLIALDGDQIVSMAWCAVKKNYVQPIEKTISIQNGTGCYYHGLTAPDYRGRGLFGAGICRLANILRERGSSEMFLYISSDNQSSMKGAMKTIFKPYVEEELTRILWMRFYKRRKINTGYEGII